MNIRTVLVAVLVSLASIAPTMAQSVPAAPPLASWDLPFVQQIPIPGSNFSKGWDAIKAVTISETQLLRFFYRKVDGLTVAVMEDTFGNVYSQSQAWLVGKSLEQFDVTLVARSQPWSASLVVFGYNPGTGMASRRLVYWEAYVR